MPTEKVFKMFTYNILNAYRETQLTNLLTISLQRDRLSEEFFKAKSINKSTLNPNVFNSFKNTNFKCIF